MGEETGFLTMTGVSPQRYIEVVYLRHESDCRQSLIWQINNKLLRESLHESSDESLCRISIAVVGSVLL